MQQVSTLKQFVTNTALVSIVQWAIQLLPFATLPILIGSLGIGGYGELSICLAFSAYVTLIVDFGFGWSATKKLAATTASTDKAVMFWDVLYAKIALMPLSLTIPLAACIFINSSHLKELILISCAVSMAGSILNPSWYLLGTGRALKLSLSIFIWRIIQLFFTLWMISSEKDVWIAVLIELFMSYFIAIYNFNILQEVGPPTPPDIHSIKRCIKQSLAFFTSNAACSFYSTINPIILASFSSSESVGAYSIAEKLVNAIKRSTHPIFQTAYPRWVQLNKEKSKDLHKETLIFLTGLIVWGGGTWITLEMFGGEILNLISSIQIPKANEILSILAITPLLAVLSHFAGYQILAPNNKEHIQTVILTICGTLGLISSIILAYSFSIRGLAWSIVGVEIAIMLLMCKYALDIYTKALPH